VNFITDSINLQGRVNALRLVSSQDSVVVHFTIDPRIEAESAGTRSSVKVGQATRIPVFVRTLDPMTESYGRKVRLTCQVRYAKLIYSP
jgi:hypothetical protein